MLYLRNFPFKFEYVMLNTDVYILRVYKSISHASHLLPERFLNVHSACWSPTGYISRMQNSNYRVVAWAQKVSIAGESRSRASFNQQSYKTKQLRSADTIALPRASRYR